ncbi:MAG: FAD-dependent oxidoreductase [Clostridia bacterium]|nr:FAD-dependent oxidoreductase [Clostridia bacterium]
MIIINNLNLPLDADFENLNPFVAKALKTNENNIISAKLYKKSVDARRKNDVHFCCSVVAEIKYEQRLIKNCKNALPFTEKEYIWQKCKVMPKYRPVVVGFGPAGMFCALTLARAGIKPIVIERGSSVENRTKAVNNFFAGGKLNPECNVQFGEGGAGTFSDGKLTTGIKNPKCRTVIKTLYEMGADKKILTDAKPHIGTDVLVKVVKNIRKEIISLGGEILFDTRLDNINFIEQKVISITTNGDQIPCDIIVLATGHSARDTYKMLYDSGVEMVQKPFAVGVRIEHLAKDINKALYGEFYNHPSLSAADYKLACHLENGRGVYTFCMCPGGEVINASSQIGGIAVNGMSNSDRDGINSNSALLVGVETNDFPSGNLLAGCELQEKIEKAAYAIAKGKVPVNTVGNFVFGKKFEITNIVPTVKPDYVFSDFSEIFPSFVIDSLKKGIKEFGKKIKGYDDESAVLVAPETRSSAPVRILRGEDLQSVSFSGLYPCGEGAGYAGGIVSAAVDGMTVAEEIINRLNKD